jgi:DNA-binding transcriptional LysR family regulator
MPTAEFDRGDVELLLAIADSGSLVKAAQALGVHHATAFRRLTDMEHMARSLLFERLPHGYELTRAGELLVEPARQLQRQFREFDARVLNFDQALTGTVRVTTSDGLATAFLAPHFRSFSEICPQIVIELVVENHVSDLAEREVDVAIRPAQRLTGNMVGRKAAAMGYSLYASREYLDRCGQLDPQEPDFSGHALCHYHPSIEYFSTAKWLNRHARKARVAARCNHLGAMLALARAGVGIAAIPCVLGDAEKDLVRLLDPVPAMTTSLWLCTHPNIRKVARIRALLDFLFDSIRRDSARLMGEKR